MESEVELDWKVSTGKHRAACEALDIPLDSPADVLLDALLEDVGSLNRIVGMVLGVAPARRIDAMIDRLMARRPKKSVK